MTTAVCRLKIMMRMVLRLPATLLAALLVSWALSHAHAASEQRSYQAVMHIRDSHAATVLDRSNHVVGIGKFRGLAIFQNGEIAIHRYEGAFDLIDGAGGFHGYALWTFEDGSELRARYRGSATPVGEGNVSVEATFADFVGTGRFAGRKIQGGFRGRRYESFANGGSTYVKGQLTISDKP